MSEIVVTVTHTVMDGIVVRWYSSPAAEQSNSVWVSASRNGVLVEGFLHNVPADVLVAATRAYEQLRAGLDDEVYQLATHRRSSLFGPLRPIGGVPS